MIHRIAVIALSGMFCTQVVQGASALKGTGDALKSPIHGMAVTEEGVEGKVVLFEYWGTRCPPCRASLPHLDKLHKKYAPSGKFTVIASHVQTKSDATLDLVEDVTFPVYQQLWLKHAPCGRGIPHAVLFDHNGEIIQQGHPARMYDEIPKLIKAVPENGGSGSMLDGVELDEFTVKAKTLVPGRSIRSTVGYLRLKAKQGNDEAQSICDAVDSWIESESASARELASSRPTQALEKYMMLSKTLSGMPESTELRREMATLQADSSIRALQSIQRDIERIQTSMVRNGRTRMTDASIASAVKKVERVLASQKISEGVRREAEDMKSTLQF